VDVASFEENFKKLRSFPIRARIRSSRAAWPITARKPPSCTPPPTASRRPAQVLGDEVAQKGSNITAERLRFDFTFGRKMTRRKSRKWRSSSTRRFRPKRHHLPRNDRPEAKAEGAIGLFEKKYGEKVRTYKMGDFSFEICGGPTPKTPATSANSTSSRKKAPPPAYRRIKAILK
jgi:alanyl-tRNA synthetase